MIRGIYPSSPPPPCLSTPYLYSTARTAGRAFVSFSALRSFASESEGGLGDTQESLQLLAHGRKKKEKNKEKAWVSLVLFVSSSTCLSISIYDDSRLLSLSISNRSASLSVYLCGCVSVSSTPRAWVVTFSVILEYGRERGREFLSKEENEKGDRGVHLNEEARREMVLFFRLSRDKLLLISPFPLI